MAGSGELAWWIMPTRARPTRARLALDAGLRLDESAAYLVAVDTDDPCQAGYADVAAWTDREWPGRVCWDHAPRETVTGIINRLALDPALPAAAARHAGFIGDDHLPKTPGWTGLLAAALDAGAPFAYGDDLHQREQLPTFYLARIDVARALGWLACPAVAHYYFDNACLDLGAVYVPGCVAEHRHWLFQPGQAGRDQTYADAEHRYVPDADAYHGWQADTGPAGMAAARETVRVTLFAAANPAVVRGAERLTGDTYDRGRWASGG